LTSELFPPQRRAQAWFAVCPPNEQELLLYVFIGILLLKTKQIICQERRKFSGRLLIQRINAFISVNYGQSMHVRQETITRFTWAGLWCNAGEKDKNCQGVIIIRFL
jgi:hypothetical protein